MPPEHLQSPQPTLSPADPDAPVEPGTADYAPSGVDRSLIRWMLELTPLERLQVIQDQVNAIQEFKASIDTH